jgi:hypothetical protein
MMMAMQRLLGALFVVLVLTVGSSFAQQIEIEAPTPERPRPPLIVPPGDHFQMTHPSDSNYYPSPPLVNFDPAFIEPLSKRIETPTSTGRFGLAGWVLPNTPVGAEVTGWRRDPGWFALGFTIEWGGPPPPPPAKRPPSR